MYKKRALLKLQSRPEWRHLQLGLLAGAAHRALDETIGVGLWRVHLGVLAGVLGALVPVEVWEVLESSRKKSQYRDIPISK